MHVLFGIGNAQEVAHKFHLFLGHRDAETRRKLFFGDVNLIVNLIINRFKYYF